MRIIGLDLAITSAHKVVVMDERGKFLTPVFPVTTWAESLAALLQRAREGAEANCPLVVVMEPTGAAWLPVAIYLIMRAVTVYLVNGQQVADLRRFYKRHAKSDRIDARVLAKLYLVAQEKLHALSLSPAALFSLQRGCKQLDWVISERTKLINQIIALDRMTWLGGWEDLGFGDPFSTAACWCREHYYSPVAVLEAGEECIRQAWYASELAKPGEKEVWIPTLVELAQKVMAVYGNPCPYVDFTALQAEAALKQKWLGELQMDRDHLRKQVIFPLYHQLHPSGNLESLYGVGEESAAVFLSFIGDPLRFPSGRQMRGWSGMIPDSRQSSGSESKGLRISQAGPNLIKKFAFLDADVARRYDPQLAALYYDQMVNRGKHHTQAVCTVATHLLDRVWVVVAKDKPYELRDVDGRPVTPEQARQIIAEKYTVPEEVRKRNNRKARRERIERHAERSFSHEERVRESLPDLVRG
ncbi:MAG: transposase [Planctomycetes bacterium]|nr:transposase [Planctomycetota bacterium]